MTDEPLPVVEIDRLMPKKKGNKYPAEFRDAFWKKPQKRERPETPTHREPVAELIITDGHHTKKIRRCSKTLQRLAPKAARALREAQVLRLYSDGETIHSISVQLKITEDKVFEYLAGALRRDIPPEEIEQLRAAMVASCKAVIKDSQEQWERSCEDEVTITTTTYPDGTTETRETRKPQSGNPAHKKTIVEAIKRIAALQGLDAPKRVEMNGTRILEITETIIHTREEDERYEAIEAEFTKIEDQRGSDGKDASGASGETTPEAS